MNVYIIQFPNGKAYVGVEGKTGQRKAAHSRSAYNGSKTLVARAITKHGWENCEFSYLVQDMPPQFCYEFEIATIAERKLNSINTGYNQSSGGEHGSAGVKLGADHKSKISKANKGKTVSEETREKLRIINTGKKLSEEHKKRIGDSQIGRVGGMSGKTHSEETKIKIGAAGAGTKNPFYGKKHSEKTIAAVIASNKRRAKK